MGIMFIILAWLGLMSVFAVILFIVIAIIDPTGNLSHDGLLKNTTTKVER